MKTTIQALMVFFGIILAAATLAPRPPIIVNHEPQFFACPVQSSPLNNSTARLGGTLCLIRCNYDDGTSLGFIKLAPGGVCQAADGGAFYQ